jgi:hypothetical protein
MDGYDITDCNSIMFQDESQYIIKFANDANTGFYWNDSTRDLYLYDDGVNRFKFDIDTGQFDADGDIVAYSTSVSDKRLKKNIEILKKSESLSQILKLQGISFERIDENDGDRHVGYIAQEIENFIPEVVVEKDLLGHEGQGKFKTIRYQEIIPIITEAMKEQQIIINDQQKEIDDLKTKMDKILEKLNK